VVLEAVAQGLVVNLLPNLQEHLVQQIQAVVAVVVLIT